MLMSTLIREAAAAFVAVHIRSAALQCWLIKDGADEGPVRWWGSMSSDLYWWKVRITF